MIRSDAVTIKEDKGMRIYHNTSEVLKHLTVYITWENYSTHAAHANGEGNNWVIIGRYSM